MRDLRDRNEKSMKEVRLGNGFTDSFWVRDGEDKVGGKYAPCDINCDHNLPREYRVWHDAAHTETLYEVDQYDLPVTGRVAQ